MKTSDLILLIISIFIFIPNDKCFAQGNPSIEWEKTFGGSGSETVYSVYQTADGGFIAGGYLSGDFYLFKVDADGELIWDKTHGLNDRWEGAHNLASTSDGGTIMAGVCDGNPPMTWHADIYVIKTDSDGNFEWDSQIGLDEVGESCSSIKQTNDGGYILCGYYWASSETGYDVILIKLLPNGTVDWQKEYDFEGEADYALSVNLTSDGGYVVAGKTQAYNELYDFDAFIFKTNTFGDSLWFKTYGFDWPQDESANHVFQTIDNGFLLVGSSSEAATVNKDWYILKTNQNGNLLWEQTYGGTYQDVALHACETVDGYVATGSIYIDGNWHSFMIKYDIDGDTLWTKLWGNEDYAQTEYCVRSTTDNGFIVAGMTGTESNGSDAHLTKFHNDAVGIVEQKIDEKLFDITNISPNPGINRITINYTLEKAGKIELSVYDVHGKKIKVLLNEFENSGHHETNFYMGELKGGVYIVRLSMDALIATYKLCIVYE